MNPGGGMRNRAAWMAVSAVSVLWLGGCECNKKGADSADAPAKSDKPTTTPATGKKADRSSAVSLLPADTLGLVRISDGAKFWSRLGQDPGTAKAGRLYAASLPLTGRGPSLPPAGSGTGELREIGTCPRRERV